MEKIILLQILIIIILIIAFLIYVKRSKKEVVEEIKAMDNKKITEEKQIDEFETKYLPNAYFVDEIVLMPKNTNCIFAYWEVRDDTYLNLKEKENINDDITIRIYKNSAFYKSLHNLPRLGSCYITEVDVNETYYVVIGFENQNNTFFEIARSNYVVTPDDKQCEEESQLWGISKIVDGKVVIDFYTRENLPKEFYFNQEILDSELLKDETQQNFTGSSENNFLGSSEKMS